MTEQVEFFDLIKARDKISKITTPIILINAPGSIRFLGALAIDRIFKTLSREFCIEKQIFRVDDDLAGLFQAIDLGYKDILYTGSSISAQKLLLKSHF
jgi:hypothetical protein